MLEQIILGIIQGITEWLPISSSGMITLAKQSAFHSALTIEDLTKEVLFLHLGTFFAALIYFAKEIIALAKDLPRFKSASKDHQNTIQFLIISTLISGTIGFALIKALGEAEKHFELHGKFITLLVGLLLFITAYLELKASKDGHKDYKDICLKDSIILGVAQGFSVLPGLSRSGLTVSMLLLRKFNKEIALKLSFLMSLPIVLAGNIILNIDKLNFSVDSLTGLAFSFLFGIITIHYLLALAKKINFGYFLILFGVLTVLSVFV